MAFNSDQESLLTASDIFKCHQCGECCKGYGGTLVNDSDVQAIAGHIGVSAESVILDYCVQSDFGRVLVQGKDGFCIFARSGRCSIHPVKPRMCKSWPFIEGVLRAPENWYIMAGACPGIRVDVSESTILRCVDAALKDIRQKADK